MIGEPTNICTLYVIGSNQGQQLMVMELLDGQPLKDRIARGEEIGR